MRRKYKTFKRGGIRNIPPPIINTNLAPDATTSPVKPQTEAENPQTEAENPQKEPENPQKEPENPQKEAENPQKEAENPETEAENPHPHPQKEGVDLEETKEWIAGQLSENQKEALGKAQETAILMGKTFLKFFNWFGMQGVDWLGFFLGFNVGGKPISKQSVPELLESFTKLQEKINDPQIQAKLQDLIASLMKTGEAASKTGITTITDIIKDIPPLSFVLDGLDLADGLTKTAEKINENLQKLVDFQEATTTKMHGGAATKTAKRIRTSLNEFLYNGKI